MTEIEIWTKWESQIVNGLFPLRRFLGRSNHSVVFLTDHKSQGLSKAAIKLIPADPAVAEAQLAQWKSIAALSHPNLIRILDTGHCKLGGHPFLFFVMEFAEQTLAQILPHRALTADEAREMLIPTLGALAYLHRKNLVHGQLKPTNFLVVNDQLKLASDTIRPAGQRPATSAKLSGYDAPEAKDGAIESPADVWGLGITLVEALTQNPPGGGEPSDIVLAALPAAFVDAVRQSLSRNPSGRPTILELEAQFGRVPQAPEPTPSPPAVIKEPAVPREAAELKESAVLRESGVLKESAVLKEPAVLTAPTQTAARQNPSAARQHSPQARLLVPAIAVGLIVLVAIWAVMRPFRQPTPQPAAPSSAQAFSQQPASQLAASRNSTSAMSAPGAVLHQDIPVISRSARNSIHGQIKVAVLVTVDRSGSVVAATLEANGASKYFARLATESAKKWRFAPADNQESRQWLLQFEFTRTGAAGQAVPHSPR
jgi:serine/threonine protein kinase